MQKSLRDAAVARFAERAAQLKEQQTQAKHEQGKFAVRQQMKVCTASISHFDILSMFYCLCHQQVFMSQK